MAEWKWVKQKGSEDSKAWALCKGRGAIEGDAKEAMSKCKPESGKVPCDKHWHTRTLGAFSLRMSGGTSRSADNSGFEAQPCRPFTPIESGTYRGDPKGWLRDYQNSGAAHTFIRLHDLDLGYRMSRWAGEGWRRETYDNTERHANQPIAEDAATEYDREATDHVVCDVDPQTEGPCTLERNTGDNRGNWDTKPNDPKKANKTEGWMIKAQTFQGAKDAFNRRQLRAFVCVRAQFRCSPTAPKNGNRLPGKRLYVLAYWPRPDLPPPVRWRTAGINWVVLDFNRPAPPPPLGVLGRDERPSLSPGKSPSRSRSCQCFSQVTGSGLGSDRSAARVGACGCSHKGPSWRRPMLWWDDAKGSPGGVQNRRLLQAEDFTSLHPARLDPRA